MVEQKYSHRQELLFIDFPGYALYPATVQIYEPSTKLYRINYKIPGVSELFFNDVDENALITLKEITAEKNSVNRGLPEGYRDQSQPAFIFLANNKIYVGTVNFAGQWLDQNSDQFIEDVTHWCYRKGFPDTGTGNVRFYDEGEKLDDPIEG